MTKPYLNNVIISPHLYGSSVSLVSSGYSGVELYNKLSTSVGYLNKQGYCMGTNCHVFPILVGETGSDLQDPRDLAFYESLRKYLKLEGDANDGCHNAITNVMWWSYNANSGDTKGIVLDDWTTINWRKIQLLEKLIDLKPWYSPQGLAGGIETVGNNAITVPQQTSFPFAFPKRGVVWDLSTLTKENTTLNGDLPVVLQRVVAFGFDSIVLPFDFNQIASTTYLANLVRNCTPTSETAARAAALPAAFNSTALDTVHLQAATGINATYTSNVCNSFLTGSNGAQRLIEIVQYLLDANLTVVLQNTNAYAAEVAPEIWLSRWVDFAITLADIDSPLLVFDLMNTTGSPMKMQSMGGRPGLSELYRSVIPAIDSILPNVNYFVEGENGDDFSSASTYFKNLQTLPWVDRVVAFSSNNPLISLAANVSAGLTYLATDGVCLTADKCHQFQTALAFPLSLNVSGTNSSILSDNSWFVEANDVRVLKDILGNLQQVGLRPWYLQRSAYNPLPGPAITPSTSTEAAQFTDQACLVGMTITNVDNKSTTPVTAAMQLQITNTQDTTLFPPWQLDISGPSLSSLVYAFESDSTVSKPGAINVTFATYHDALWPRGINSINTTVVASFMPPVSQNFTTAVNNQVCLTTVYIT